MKILVVCQYYHPEPFRIHEVCEELVRRGHEVTVLTGLPNYPMGVIPEEYKDKKHRDETVNGVHVIRVSERARTLGRVGLAKNYVSFVWHGCIKALTMKKDFDVIFVYQLSPVLMAIPAYIVKWFGKPKHIALYCLDLWPASLASLGINEKGLFYRFMRSVSIRIYKGASLIGYTSRMFEKYFNDVLGIGSKKFVHIPQFADELFSGIPEDDPAKSGAVGSGEDTIDYVFAGNVGMMQSVDTIIKAAALVKDDRIRWHIVGDGFALDDCKKLCDRMNLNGKVTFYGRLPVEEMPRFYNMADAMIVTLADNDLINYTLPGKIQSYMAAGRAVIASANGETRSVIEESGCGMCAPAEDEKEFAIVADKMAASNELAEMGRASKRYYDEHFTKKRHIDLIEEMLKECAV